MTLLLAAIATLAVVGLVIMARSLPYAGHQIQTQQQPNGQDAAAKPEPAKNDKRKANEGTEIQETQNYWERFVRFIETRDKFITAFSTILMLIVTGFVAYATYSLYGATKDLVTGAEKTAERQLRAYVSLKSFGKSPMVHTETKKLIGWEFSIVWQNTGATPTRDMLTHVSVYFEDVDLPNDFRFPDKWIIGQKQVYVPLFLAPSSTFIDGVAQFSVEQLQEVRSGKKFLYFYGWADYNDVFSNTPRHRSEFCTRVMLPGDPNFLGEANISFNFCEKHNGADSEAMREPITSVKRERITNPPK